jgi:dUTP pyrophosphatase
MIQFQVEKGAELPKYGSELASGMDVTAFKILKVFRGDREIDPENLLKVQQGFNERGYIKLRSLERILFGTGLKASIPSDSEIQVRSRSGVALKRGLSVLNSPGTVDADYTGEIGVIIYNSTPFLNQIDRGERIAQLVVSKVERPQIEQIYEDLKTVHNRGGDGFGSTGTKQLGYV